MKEEKLGILLTSYMCHCQFEKALNTHTLKAYRRDINQFIRFSSSQADPFSKENIQAYIAWLHTDYAVRSVKRKMASLKAFFTYLTFEGELADDPFSHMRIKLREPSLLPRTIPLATIDQLLRHVYSLQSIYNKRTYAYRVVGRDVAVLELLFATGIRISELCSLQPDDVGLQEGSIKIYGKGAKERLIQIGHQNVLHALRNYTHYWSADIQTVNHFFLNRLGNPLSDQSVRCMIKKYCNQSGISLHITPHMFRHPYVKHTTKIFSLRLMDFQAQAYPDARRKTRGACQLLRVGQSRSPVRPLCNRKRFSCLPPQSKMSWILYAISMRLLGYTSTRSISSSASSVVSVSASKIALDASMRLSCRACSSCFCFACANTAA